MRKWVIAAVLILAVSVSLAARGAREVEGYHLRFGHVQTSEEEYHKGYVAWAEAVRERTNGNLIIEIFPDAALGSEEDVLEQMRVGTNVGWQTDPARLGSYVGPFSVLYAPYLLSGYEDFEALIGSETIAEWSRQLEEQHGIKVVSYAWAQGFRNVFSNREARSPAEFRGIRIRTAPAPAWLATVNSLGATATGLPYGELYNAIQTGVVDGAELPYSAARALSVQEVANYVIETRHIYQMNVQAVSAQWFYSLPEEYQQILVEECNRAGLAATRRLEELAGRDKQFMVDSGMQIIGWDQVDQAAFRESGQQAYRQLGLEEARNALYAEMGK